MSAAVASASSCLAYSSATSMEPHLSARDLGFEQGRRSGTQGWAPGSVELAVIGLGGLASHPLLGAMPMRWAVGPVVL